MDAEAYPEASENVLQILWGIVTSVHPSHGLQWAMARTSAFEALTQYEVTSKNGCSNLPPNFHYFMHLIGGLQ